MRGFLAIRGKEFVLNVRDTEEVKHFPGTVTGAVELMNFIRHHNLYVMMSSDLNHPDEFPEFEKHAIDVAAGYYDGAIKAGLIEVVKEK